MEEKNEIRNYFILPDERNLIEEGEEGVIALLESYLIHFGLTSNKHSYEIKWTNRTYPEPYPFGHIQFDDLSKKIVFKIDPNNPGTIGFNEFSFYLSDGTFVGLDICSDPSTDETGEVTIPRNYVYPHLRILKPNGGQYSETTDNAFGEFGRLFTLDISEPI